MLAIHFYQSRHKVVAKMKKSASKLLLILEACRLESWHISGGDFVILPLQGHVFCLRYCSAQGNSVSLNTIFQNTVILNK